MSDSDLSRLADLAVVVGANVQPGQIVGVTAELEHYEFARAIAASAYDHGAKFVDVWYIDPLVKRARIEFAPDDTLEFVPPWYGQRVLELGEQRGANITIRGTTAPGALDGLDPKRAGRDQLPRVKETTTIVNERTVNWTILAYPTVPWARLCYPELDDDAALARLWQEVKHVSRLDEPDPLAAWEDRIVALERAAEAMNDGDFDAIHFEGEGTDLTIGLLPTSTWRMARWSTVDGIRHLPNVPSEEVFTSPDPARVEGHVRSTKPLVLSDGTLVRGLRGPVRGRPRRRDRRRRGRRGGPRPGADRRGGVAARRDRPGRPREQDRPARDGLLRDAARRERRQSHRARLRLQLGGRDRRGPGTRQPERSPPRLHDWKQRRRRHRRDEGRANVSRSCATARGSSLRSTRLDAASARRPSRRARGRRGRERAAGSDRHGLCRSRHGGDRPRGRGHGLPAGCAVRRRGLLRPPGQAGEDRAGRRRHAGLRPALVRRARARARALPLGPRRPHGAFRSRRCAASTRSGSAATCFRRSPRWMDVLGERTDQLDDRALPDHDVGAARLPRARRRGGVRAAPQGRRPRLPPRRAPTRRPPGAVAPTSSARSPRA